MIFFVIFCLALAVVGSVGLILLTVQCYLWRRRMEKRLPAKMTARDKAGIAAGAALACVAIGLGLALGRPVQQGVTLSRAERSPAELSRAEPGAAEPSPAKPSAAAPVRFKGADQERFAKRWETVYREVGPPPHPDAVPCEGYVTASGYVYRSYWRMPPGAVTSNRRASK